MAPRVTTAEISISRYLDRKTFEVSTNDRREAKRLFDMGWTPVSAPGSKDGYWTFHLPLTAILVRSKATVDGFKNRGVGQ